MFIYVYNIFWSRWLHVSCPCLVDWCTANPLGFTVWRLITLLFPLVCRWYCGSWFAPGLILTCPIMLVVWVFGCLGVSPRGLGWLHSLGFRMASPAWRGFIRQHFSQQIRQVGYGDFYPETLAGYIVVSMLTFVSVPPACKQAALRPKRRFNQHGKLESEGKK